MHGQDDRGRRLLAEHRLEADHIHERRQRDRPDTLQIEHYILLPRTHVTDLLCGTIYVVDRAELQRSSDMYHDQLWTF